MRIVFQAPSAPVSENWTRGHHWAKVRRALAPWKVAACLLARSAVRTRPAPVPITVQVDLPFRTVRRRDPHNYVGTNVKAIVDGLVQAGLVPDDTPDWVTVLEPTLHTDPGPGYGTVTVTITERTDP